MQGINILFTGINEKFSKLESQISTPKVEIQHQKQEKGMRAIFLMRKNQFPRP